MSLNEEDFRDATGGDPAPRGPVPNAIKIVEVTPEDFANSVVEFYKALKAAMPEIKEDFAERLTIAFVGRP